MTQKSYLVLSTTGGFVTAIQSASHTTQLQYLRMKVPLTVLGRATTTRTLQIRRMAEESWQKTIIPPPPPDKASDVARIGIVSFGVLLGAYIVMMPENNYDSIGLMSPPKVEQKSAPK